ncbi:MAG TPA: hypothetical protein VK841_21050 [Polyangiaceae bacterium]|jgi:hypothetical protein|nr:hypothetical protein [Polyangiaceae bacterium]
MPNQAGDAYALTTICPLENDAHQDRSVATVIRQRLKDLPLHEHSPFARVPNLYLCRLFVLDELTYQGSPARLDRLRSKYLVFVCDLHGPLDPFLAGLWDNAKETLASIFAFCVGFKDVRDGRTFAAFIEKCQLTTTFYFNGSTDAPLAEQLKALYLKQEFAKFAMDHQGEKADALQRAFADFVKRVEPSNLAGPTWRAGASTLDAAEVRA